MTQNKRKKQVKERRQRIRSQKRGKKSPASSGWDPVRDSLPDEVIKEWNRAREAEKIRQRLGLPRPIVSSKFQGQRVVAVGPFSYFGDWKTFPDFLMYYIRSILGNDWGAKELKKPFEEMHPIMQWFVEMCRFQKKQTPNKDGMYGAVPNGATVAYLFLSYDLYLLAHNAEIQSELVRRLRIKEQFQGARYELFAAATCIRAGFDLQFEDETDRSKRHVEFIGTHRPTGQKISVEAKSRHREGVLGVPGKIKAEDEIKVRIGGLLNDALGKDHSYPLVIFIDVNIPPSKARKIFEKPISSELKKIINRLTQEYGYVDKFNLLVFTNHPHHYARPDDPDPRKDVFAILPSKSEIVPQYPGAIKVIFDEALAYGKLPQFFPKELMSRETTNGCLVYEYE